jgi:hypothetical protein
MAETPKHPELEKLLRDYAEQRRTAAGSPQMHAATREMLQAEVVRQHGAIRRPLSARTSWLSRYWPRLAFGGGLAVVLIVIAAILVPPATNQKQAEDFAKLDSSPTLNLALTPQPAPAPAPAAVPVATHSPAASPPMGSLEREREETMATSRLSGERSQRDAPTLARRVEDSMKTTVTRGDNTPPSLGIAVAKDAAKLSSKDEIAPVNTPGTLTVSGTAGTIAFGTERKGSLAGTAPLLSGETMADTVKFTVAAEATSGLAATTARERLPKSPVAAEPSHLIQSGSTQFYRNLATSENAKKSTPPAVLDEFTVAQEGENLTVVDRDGSVYNGFVRAAPATAGNVNLVYSDEHPMSLTTSPTNAELKAKALAVAASQATHVNGSKVENGDSNALEQTQVADAAQNWFFRVEGTNRSLRQRVIFSGNLLQNNAQIPLQNAGHIQSYYQQFGEQKLSNAFTPQVPTANNFINGRVQLGDSKTTREINAQSVSP